MTALMPQVQPWAEYLSTAELLEPPTALADALDAPDLIQDRFLYPGVLSMLEQLQVGFFQAATPSGTQYHLVQLGEDIPDCERVLLWRGAEGFSSDAWYTADEQTATSPDDRDLISHLQGERYLREVWQSVSHPKVDQHIHWHAYKLTSGRGEVWGRTVEGLQGLHERGHSNQAIHDLLYHYPTWQQANPEFAGMPHELALRMHGLAAAVPLLADWQWLKDAEATA